ncbi:MAG: hypothetical protein MRY74_04870 [Neomegalonema sp.]|nr:hypothetical protein [Neomegalonema sp.]
MLRIAAVAVVLMSAFAAPAAAELALERSQSEYATVELGADVNKVAPGEKVRVVLRQTLSFGWHSYWVNPGDTGMPTSISWTAPEGVTVSPIAWPTPERQPLPPLMNFGYSGEVLLVSTVTTPADWPLGKPIPLSATAQWLVCKDACIVEKKTFTLLLPTAAKTEPDAMFAGLAEYAVTTLPKDLGEVGVYTADGAQLRLSFPAAALGDGPLGDGYFFPETAGLIAASTPQKVEVKDGRVLITMTRAGTDGIIPAAKLTGRLSGVFKTKDAKGAVAAVRLTATGPTEASK